MSFSGKLAKKDDTNLSNNNSFLKSNLFKLFLLSLSLSIFIYVNYEPLPDHFEQSLKYTFICFGSDMLRNVGRVLEYFEIGHRLNLTRFAYHIALGTLNIRDSTDPIEIKDEIVEHVPIRIYKPLNRSSNSIPTIIFYHGGGYFLGTADIIEPVTYLLAKQTNFQVVYIEFRLIPEHKYPAALDDSLLATLHLIKHYKAYRIDLNNLILMGDSAGGNLATVISRKLIENNVARPKLQVLVYPILQFFDFTLPSYRINMPKRILGQIDHENFKNFLHYFTGIEVDDSVLFNGHTDQYHKDSLLSEYVNVGYLPNELRNHGLGELKQQNDTSGKYSRLAEILLHKDVSPLLVSDEYMSKYTPINTYLVTAELDILRDDGFIYAERLRNLGFNVIHYHFDNFFHGVINLLHGPLQFNAAHALMQNVSSSIKSIISS